MSAIASPAIFARKALAGNAVAGKRTATKARAAFSVNANAKVDACDKNSVIVSPSILSANFATLGAEVSVRVSGRNTQLSSRAFQRASTSRKKRTLSGTYLSFIAFLPGCFRARRPRSRVKKNREF